MGPGTFSKIVEPPQEQRGYPLSSISAIWIENLIQGILENRIQQQPGPYLFLISDKDIIYIR